MVCAMVQWLLLFCADCEDVRGGLQMMFMSGRLNFTNFDRFLSLTLKTFMGIDSQDFPTRFRNVFWRRAIERKLTSNSRYLFVND